MKEYGILKENVFLKNYNTYKIGGKVKYLIKPYDINNLILLLDYLKTNKINYFIIGKGSNIILPDQDYNGAIILLDNLNKISIKDNYVNVESGISLNNFILKLVNENLKGLENLCGIPGTVGGAIVQNAGCYNSTISDHLESVTYLEKGIIKTIEKDKCNFKYRNSIFKKNKNLIVLSCTFKLEKGYKEEMLSIIKEHNLKRKNTQPLLYPNAGSVFKNPINNSAGKLIDELGLKNYHINDAYISEKHANFIINKGNAKSKDIIDLIKYIKKEVKNKYDIDLELEQEIIKY